MWNLYGNTYDLESFLDKHPGGKEVLNKVKGENDITPLFESYHAMANFGAIYEQLQQYKVKDNSYQQKYTFCENGFYKTVVKRVRGHFSNKFGSNKQSFTNLIKINNWWIFKTVFEIVLFFLTFFVAFYSNCNTVTKTISSFTSAYIFGSLGFNIMHDASHYALFDRKNNKMNSMLSRIWHSIGLWSHDLWFYHHVYRHHSFTGDLKLDPDIVHLMPFMRKHPLDKQTKYFRVPKFIRTLYVFFVLWIFPGRYFGQVLAYLEWRVKGRMWRMNLPSLKNNRYDYVFCVPCLFLIYSHIYQFNIFVTLAYFIGLNLIYDISIATDHDTLETIENTLNTLNTHNENALINEHHDWGKMQVISSGNFANGSFMDMFSELHGGINYQIEHHLFPSICHVHYPDISKIIKQTCHEFQIKYVAHLTLVDAYKDFLKAIYLYN